ncbi:MAG: sulfite exporter TauE/SafE family protein [Sphingobium sp.]
MASPLTLAGGALLGLASSLHCIGMCGGIAAMALAAGPEGTFRASIGTTMLTHAGRVLAYVFLGAMAGGIGTAAITVSNPEFGHRLLRWAAALSLGWIGLSTAGWLPGPDRFLPHMPALLRRFGGSRTGPLLVGIGWGLMPCGMVYGALLYALFSGSIAGGATVMAGFGFGTLPALLFSTAGFIGLRTLGRRRETRIAVGLAIAAIAILSLTDPGPMFGALCRSIGL